FVIFFFFFSSRRRHTRFSRDWSSDVCSSDLHRYISWAQSGSTGRKNKLYVSVNPSFDGLLDTWFLIRNDLVIQYLCAGGQQYFFDFPTTVILPLSVGGGI